MNVGLAHRQVPGGDVLLLNPDAEISVKATQQLQRALLTDDRLASVGPRQVDESGNPIRVSWPFASPWGVWLDAVGLSRLRPASEYVSGAILLLRAEAIDQVGACSTMRSSCMQRKRTGPTVRASLAGATR